MFPYTPKKSSQDFLGQNGAQMFWLKERRMHAWAPQRRILHVALVMTVWNFHDDLHRRALEALILTSESLNPPKYSVSVIRRNHERMRQLQKHYLFV